MVTVVTVVYNNVKHVRDAILSVISQEYPHIQHVVIDGGSTDNTVEIIQEYSSQISVFLSEPDKGMYDALNKGIARSCGDIVGFLHSDDLFRDPNVLENIVTAFNDPEVDVAYGDLNYVSASDPNRVIRRWRSGSFSPRKLAWGWMPPHPTLFLRRSLYEQIGGFNTRYRIAADYDHILRVFSRQNLKSEYIPQVLVKMRVGGLSNRSFRNIVQKSKEDYRVLKENNIGGIGTLLWKNISKIPQFF